MGFRSSCGDGITQIWKLWRHCCCRYGWYPLLVAPIVTCGCLLDLYSSFDCQFMRVNVGFTPSNPAWNQSTADLGLFFYRTGNTANESFFKEMIAPGCQEYSLEFEEQFVVGDRTWEVAKIMAFISGSAAVLATVTAWLIVLSPAPACLFWPGVLLPAVMIAFLAEGSKFLILDTGICHWNMWFPSGPDSLPVTAESCQLGKTSYVAIGAGLCFVICLFLVCLKAPEKRKLEEEYGETQYLPSEGVLEFTSDEDINEQFRVAVSKTDDSIAGMYGSDAGRWEISSKRSDGDHTASIASSSRRRKKRPPSSFSKKRGKMGARREDVENDAAAGSSFDSRSQQGVGSRDSYPTISENGSYLETNVRDDWEVDRDNSKEIREGKDYRETHNTDSSNAKPLDRSVVLKPSGDSSSDSDSRLVSKKAMRKGGNYNNHNNTSQRGISYDNDKDKSNDDIMKKHDNNNYGSGNPTKTVSPPRISHARAAKAEMMHMHVRNTSDELIEKCVLDLQKAFQADSPTGLPLLHPPLRSQSGTTSVKQRQQQKEQQQQQQKYYSTDYRTEI